MWWKLIRFNFFIGVIAFISSPVYSQSVSDLFHSASQFYINGKTAECKQTIAQALALYPNDRRIIALKNKLKEEPPKQQKNKNQQDKQNQNDKKDQQQKQQQQQKQDQNQQQKQGQNKEISKDDAQRMLDAVQNDEKNLKKRMEEQKASSEKVKVIKNW